MTLDQIAIRTGTDKCSKQHGYTKIYEQYFEPLRHQAITLWEAGYGGYNYPDRGGQSAQMWRQYFINAKIVVTDLYPKTNVPERVHFECGDQDDKGFWERVMVQHGSPDVFVDDASHVNPLSIATFKIIFPILLPGGIYVWEDLESSAWGEIAQDGTNFHGTRDAHDFYFPTALNFLRSLINDVNVSSIPHPRYPIEWIHFYDNIAFIKKK